MKKGSDKGVLEVGVRKRNEQCEVKGREEVREEGA